MKNEACLNLLHTEGFGGLGGMCGEFAGGVLGGWEEKASV